MKKADEYAFILDSFTWSHSRLKTYAECPKAFKLQYIDCKILTDNAFAEWGRLCHSVLEQFYKGNIMIYEMSDDYKKKYDDFVKNDFPFNKFKNLNESYYKEGEKYFDRYSGLNKNLEIVAVEEKVKIEIEGYKFIGIIDLVVRDKIDNKYIIIDHKSKSGFKNAAELSEYLLQLYLYSIAVYNKYGEYPKELWFNLFRAGKVVKHDFSTEEIETAKEWFVSTIKKIYSDTEYTDKITKSYEESGKDLSDFKCTDYYCNNLCAVREHCEKARCAVYVD